jgi:hypothetical protein
MPSSTKTEASSIVQPFAAAYAVRVFNLSRDRLLVVGDAVLVGTLASVDGRDHLLQSLKM